MPEYSFRYKRLGILEIEVIVKAKSIKQAIKQIKTEDYDWTDYNHRNDEMLRIFDIEFIDEVEEGTRFNDY
jgi:hypothetical protein